MVEALSSGGDEIMSAVAALTTNHKSNDKDDDASENNSNHNGASSPNPAPNITSIQQRAIDDDVSFRVGESMMWNFVRMLAKPAATAQVHFLPATDATGKPRRVLADTARAAVISSYET